MLALSLLFLGSLSALKLYVSWSGGKNEGHIFDPNCKKRQKQDITEIGASSICMSVEYLLG